MVTMTTVHEHRTASEHDVVGELIAQHDRIEEEFTEVENATGPARVDAFESLRTLLAAHETAEEIVVRPVTRSLGGDAIADARITEEREAKEVLAELDRLDVTDEDFAARLAQLREMVATHAHNEERHEFPLLRDRLDAERSDRLARRVERVESVAPTHAHPHVNSATANTVLGPFAALLDRVRDAFADGDSDEHDADDHERPAGSPRSPSGVPLTGREALRAEVFDPAAGERHEA